MNGIRALDNPFWSSLASRHRGVALRHGDVARYPAGTRRSWAWPVRS